MPDKQAAIASLSSALEAASAFADALYGPLALKQGDYPVIRANYRAEIAQAMTEYLASDKPSTSYKSRFNRAMIESFSSAFYTGYAETSGSLEDVDPEADQWLTSRQNTELGYIGELFVSLKAARDEFWRGEIDADDLRELVGMRVNGYANSLEAVYQAGRMWGAKNKMLTWHLGRTQEHCQTCTRLDGKAHRAKWFLARNYIPRRPGASMECGGYQCQCYFTDREGNTFTL